MSSKHIQEPRREDGSRPTKRRRIEMPFPDGFSLSRPNKLHKPSVPRFHSAFGDDAMDRNVDKETIIARKTFVEHVSAPSKLPRQSHCDVTNQKSERPKETRKLSSMMDIPMKVSLNQATTKPRSTSNLRPAPPPPAVASSSAVAQVGFKQIVPPAFPLIKPASTSKSLQPLQLSVIPAPLPVVSTKKELRALSTTGLGILSDLSSDNVAEGLASILLHDQHPELLLNQSEANILVSRGLEMSPDKKGKNKNTKFVRGGLAAYASLHFDRITTAHILWRKGLEHNTNTLPAPEFCAAVIKILHKPTYTLRPSSYSPGIALCQIRQQNGMPHATYKPDCLFKVVFATLNGSTSDFPTQFSEGQTILIFKPWQELSKCPDKRGSETPEPPRQPLRLPLPVPTPESTPNPLDAPIHDISLVCTRFHIQQ